MYVCTYVHSEDTYKKYMEKTELKKVAEEAPELNPGRTWRAGPRSYHNLRTPMLLDREAFPRLVLKGGYRIHDIANNQSSMYDDNASYTCKTHRIHTIVTFITHPQT